MPLLASRYAARGCLHLRNQPERLLLVRNSLERPLQHGSLIGAIANVTLHIFFSTPRWRDVQGWTRQKGLAGGKNVVLVVCTCQQAYNPSGTLASRLFRACTQSSYSEAINILGRREAVSDCIPISVTCSCCRMKPSRNAEGWQHACRWPQ